MFVLCPHCEFLVGVDPRTGQPPAACPRCGQALESAQVDVPAEAVEILPAAPADPGEDAAPPEPAKPQLDPDAVIAAMSAQPRKPRAKPKPDSGVKPRPRRKRAEAPPPAPAAAAPDTTPAVPARAPTPSLRARLSAWWSPGTQAPSPAPVEPAPAPPADATKRRASVRPIPSLRDRAAARAAAKHATPLAEIDALAVEEAPAFDDARAVPADEAPVVAPTVVAPTTPASIAAAPIVEAPPIEAPARVDAGPVESAPLAPVDAPAQEVPAPPAPLPDPRLLAPRPPHAPSFLRTRTGPATRVAPWRQFATLGGLALLLGAQLLLAQRDALAANARWRPTIDALCTVARCTLPAWREPDAFTMLSRDVRPHAHAPGTLQIDASFRNDARWAQPWPRLVVTLSDIDGRVVGTRAFTATEYLGTRPTQNTLDSGQSATVRLAVVEPAPGVVAFSFDFR